MKTLLLGSFCFNSFSGSSPYPTQKSLSGKNRKINSHTGLANNAFALSGNEDQGTCGNGSRQGSSGSWIATASSSGQSEV